MPTQNILKAQIVLQIQVLLIIWRHDEQNAELREVANAVRNGSAQSGIVVEPPETKLKDELLNEMKITKIII